MNDKAFQALLKLLAETDAQQFADTVQKLSEIAKEVGSDIQDPNWIAAGQLLAKAAECVNNRWGN